MLENKLKNYVVLHLIVFIWGFTAILGALITIDEILLVFFRMGLSVFFIAIYFLIKKKSFYVDKRGLLKFLIDRIPRRLRRWFRGKFENLRFSSNYK